MKKILLVLLVLLPFLGFTQVKLFTTDASKEYPDGTRITYFTVSDCPDDSEFLAYSMDYVLKDDRMIRFKISKDGKSCFYEASKEVTEEMIVEAINDAILKYAESPQKHERDFANRGYVNDLHLTKFTLDIDIDDDLLHEIITIFKESDIIIDVDFRNNSQFEVTSKELIYPADVEKLLQELDIKIAK